MAHAYTGLYYHLIFHTKSKDVLIPKHVFESLFAYIGGVIRKDGGILHEAGGMPDHIHLLLTIDRSISVANAVRAIKARSSFWLSKQGIDDFAWQGGYAIFSVSSSVVPNVQKYIQNQEEHHRKQTASEELDAFYNQYGVPKDQRG